MSTSTTTSPELVATRARVTSAVLGEVAAERGRQDAQWGEQNYPNGTGPARRLFGKRADEWRDEVQKRVDTLASRGELTYGAVLLEEVCEAYAEDDPAKVRAELIQVAAVAVAMVEKIDREASR